MSVKIIGNNIIMTRGDTLKTKIEIKDSSGKEYIPDKEDKIRFAVKKQYNDIKPTILKEIPTDTLVLELTTEDTKVLPQPYECVYDVQITLTDGTVDTFIMGKLIIMQEVD